MIMKVREDIFSNIPEDDEIAERGERSGNEDECR
jgi:hypothetical protein